MTYYREQASSKLAGEFRGVDLTNETLARDVEGKRSHINYFIEMVGLLDRIGWYDHTSDWDFHIGIQLADGSVNDHIGDGATISWSPDRKADQLYASVDNRTVLITGPETWDPNFAAQGPLFDPLVHYRKEVDKELEEVTWEFPVEQIVKLVWGYCS